MHFFDNSQQLPVQRHDSVYLSSVSTTTVLVRCFSPAGAVAKYCDEYVCLFCLSVREDISGTTRDLYQIFMHIAYDRGPAFFRHADDRPHRVSQGRGFLPHWKRITCRERGMGEHRAGEVCYLRLPCFNFCARCIWFYSYILFLLLSTISGTE